MRYITKIKLVSLLLLSFLFISLVGCDKAVIHTVTFDSAGGSTVESQDVKDGKTVNKPTDPTKTGFTFVEWQYENESYSFDTEVTQDIKLTAFYTINEGTEVVAVAFNADNGTGIETVSVAKGEPISEPPQPTKDGYIFEGWHYEDSKFDFSTKINDNILLIAKWSIDKTNTYNSDDDKHASSDKTPNTNENTNDNNQGTNDPINTTQIT